MSRLMFLRAEQLGLNLPKRPSVSKQDRKPVQHPGVRGGLGYYDSHGVWHYGEPVAVTPTRVEPSPVAPPAVEPAAPEAAVVPSPLPSPPAPAPEAVVVPAPAGPPAEVPPNPPGEPTGEPEPKRRYDPSGANVESGFYAVPSRTGQNDLDFYKVEIGKEGGRWAGMRFVGRILGGHGKPIKITRTEQADALVRIQHYGEDESRARFGQAIGQCGKCGRHLTDAVSRALGIGPECRKGMGEGMRKLVVPPVDPNMPERIAAAEIPMPEAPPPTLEELRGPTEKPAEEAPPAAVEGETAIDALRDELKIRRITISEQTTNSGRPCLAMTGNTYAHNATFQQMKNVQPRGLVWGTKIRGQFAWCTFEDRALDILGYFNAERAQRIRERDTGPGGGSGGPGGLRPDVREPSGAPGSEAGVGAGGVPSGRPSSHGGMVHAALTEQNLDRMTVEELSKIGPPAPQTPLDPSLAKILYPAQQDDVRLIADAWNRGEKGFMLGNSTGTGKTFVGLGTIRQLGMPRTLVIVPSQTVANQWVKDGKVFGIDVHTRLPESPTEPGVFATTYAMLNLKKDQLHGQFGLFIPDEIHMQGMKLSSGKTIAKLLASVSGRSRMTVYSTASPYEAPHQMYYLRELHLWPARKGAWREWAKRHGVRWISKHIGGGQYVEVAQWHGSRESKLHDILKIRGEIIGNGKGVARELELDPAIAPLTSKFTAVEEFHGDYGPTVKRAMQAMQKLSSAAIKVNIEKRLLDYVKLDAAADEAAKAVAAGQHVVMMVSNKAEFNFTDPVLADRKAKKGAKGRDIPSRIREEIIQRFHAAGLTGSLPSPTDLLREKIAAKIGAKNVETFTGDVSEGKRAKIKAAFNAGTLPVIISTIAAGGTGLSLHDEKGDAPRTQINLGLPWTGRDFQQMLGRTYRYGTKSPVHQMFLWTDHPRERSIAGVVAGRLEGLRAGVQGITAEKNVDKLVEFTVRGGDMEDDVRDEDADLVAKARAWLDKFFG